MAVSTSSSPQSDSVELCALAAPGGGRLWAYFLVPAVAWTRFHCQCRSGVLERGTFSEILLWGEGDAPPAEVRDRMEREWGVCHDREDLLLDVLTPP